MKYCPKCGYTTENEQDHFCPICVDVDEPIMLLEKEASNGEHATSDDNHTVGLNPASIPGGMIEDLGPIISVVSKATEIASKPSSSPYSKDEDDMTDSPLRGAAVGGDVTITKTNSKKSSTQIGKVIVNQPKKTVAEELTEKKRSYRAECKKYCNDGFISEEAFRKLENYRIELDLDQDIAKEILDEVKSLSKKVRTELPPAGRIKLEYAADAIARNDERAIASAIVDLEGWMGRVQVGELNQMYYQLFAIVHPGQYLDHLKKDTKEDYWKTYWSYVAYGKQGLQSEAEMSLAELTAWDSFYPTQNQSLLSVVGFLMRNEEIAARTAFSSMTPGYSKELTSVYNAIHELLETDWANSVATISPRSMFYAKSLFGEFTKSIEQKQEHAKEVASNAEAKRLEKEARKKEAEEKLQYQKETFILAYTEMEGSIDKAREKVGITNSMFNSWLSQDREFANSFKDAQEKIERKKEEARRSIEEQKERDAENNRLKNEFVQLYESNDCDLLKTCAETGIDSATFRDWKNSDQGFADKVSYIQRVHEEKLRNLQKIQKKAKMKKVAPYIAIILLLGIICLGVFIHKQKIAAEKAEQDRVELTQQAVSKYESRIVDFNQALGNANNSNIEALRIASEIFVEIRAMEATEYLSGRNESTNLRKDFNSKAQSIKESLQKLVAASDQISSTDPEGARQLKQEENNLRDIQDYINIVAK